MSDDTALELTDYRGKGTRWDVRSTKQVDQDFLDCCTLLEDGRTWQEIAIIINEVRDYTVSKLALRVAYTNRINKASLKLAPEQEKDRVIDDLRALMTKMIMQYNESLEDKIEIKEDYEYEVEEEADGTSKTIERLTHKVIKRAKSLGDTKFLDVYMKAQERMIKLMGLEAPEKKIIDFNLFLKKNPIDDTQGVRMDPITTEQEAKDLGESL